MKDEIQKIFKGEIHDDEETLRLYSTDASLFEVRPKLVVFPKDSEDIQSLVKWAGEKGESVAVRAAGSCMSGGSLSESIVADVTKHMHKLVSLDAGGKTAVVEPGLLYKDFELQTLNFKLILPCYPASKNLAALGGMLGNNCAGEKTLRYGKMENFILESKVVFSDGKEYVVRPLTEAELEEKMAQGDFEGNLYKELHSNILENVGMIEKAKPKVSKNSAGYYLWNVYLPAEASVKEGDGETFDLNRLLVGSQGTLGIITEAKIRLVPLEPVSKLFVVFLPGTERIAELVNTVLPTVPDSIETYDDKTLMLAVRFFPEMLRTLRPKNFTKLILSFIPEAFMILRHGIPKMVALVEYSGSTEEEVDQKLSRLEEMVRHFGFSTRKTKSVEEAGKYWTIRRESFNLLRKHVKGKRTAPFVDDVVVRPEDMPEFLPKMREILDAYNLTYTIAGHAGNGNFHIIPLMDMKNRHNVEVIKEVGDKVYDLVAEYKGSITGEHNDGLVRTPYLGKMYSPEVLELFKQTKQIFDPHNVLNPGKKVPSTGSGHAGALEYMEKHIARG